MAQVLVMTSHLRTDSKRYQLLVALRAPMQPEQINCIWHVK